jgi:hypothetical protein
MDDQKFSGLLSDLIPDEIENRLGLGGESSGEPDTRTVELLKAAAGQAGGGVENELNDFLNGRGALLETTRSAVARGGSTAEGRKSAASEVAAFLTNQLHLSAPLAKLVAPLAIQLFPAIGKLAGGSTTTTKPKPRRKKKKEEESSNKPRPSQTHKPKPSSSTRPASSQKPRPTSSGKPKKPKPSSSGKPKPSTARPGRKRPKRAVEIEIGPEA